MRAHAFAHGQTGMRTAQLRRTLLLSPLRCPLRFGRDISTICSATGSSRGQLDAVLNITWLLQRPETQVCQCRFPFARSLSMMLRPDDASVDVRQSCETCCTVYFCRLRPFSSPRMRQDSSASFSVIRDDLLHPIAGSKLRKFDALWPQLLSEGVTDVVSR